MEFFKKIKKLEWINLVVSVLFLIMGIILIKDSEQVLKIVSYIAGAGFLVIGIVKIIKYLRDKSNSSEIYGDIIFGMVTIIMGLIIMFCTPAIEAIFRIIIGVWIIFSGITRFELVKRLKGINSKEWIISLVLAIVVIACGLYMIFTPGTIIAILGVIVIIYAVVNLIQSIMYLKNSKVILVERIEK